MPIRVSSQSAPAVLIPIAFDSGTVPLTNAAIWTPIGPRILANGRRVAIHGTNGPAGLANLRVSSCAVRNGTLVLLAAGTDLNAAVDQVKAIRPAYPACLAANVDWELSLEPDAADVLIEAQGVATSLRVSGMVL